jgi:hypothetical protein
MSIFSFGKNLARRAEAVEAIQQCLESLSRNGLAKLPRDYRQLASELVAAAWPTLSAAAAGAGTQPPQRLSIAAFALARGIDAKRSEPSATLLAAALRVMLKSIASEPGKEAMPALDAALVAQARKSFLDYGERLPEEGGRTRLQRPQKS